MNMLKPGDPCPCCGNPIKTTDEADLQMLSYVADWMARRGIKRIRMEVVDDAEV